MDEIWDLIGNEAEPAISLRKCTARDCNRTLIEPMSAERALRFVHPRIACCADCFEDYLATPEDFAALRKGIFRIKETS